MNAETPETPETPPSTDPPARTSRLLLVGVAVVAAVALFWPRGESGPPLGPGGFLVDEAGRKASLVDQLGEATLVHFWATWCAPCQVELPKLVRFTEETAGSRLKVLFIAVADEPEAARRFLDAPSIPLYFDPIWEVARRFGTEALPETHLVVGGEVVRSFIGATEWDDPAIRAALQNWTASPTSATP